MGADQLESGQELDEEELRKRVLQYHQDHVSRMLTWVDVEEQRAVHLGDYKNVVRDLADSSLDDWVLLRAAMLHVACSENLNLEHNWWLGQEIYASFEKEFHHLQYVVSRTRADRPTPRFDPQEMFPNYRMTDEDAIYYYSRAALALLVSREDPGQAIGLFEDLNSIFVPRIRCHLPQGRHSLHLDGELERLPLLYERVGRFEDALNLTPVSFAHSWSSPSPCEVAVRRLGGWVNQLSGSGSVSTVERCLDKIYEWMESATDVDEEERDRIGECPTITRQFWAWYYGNALGRLIVARTSSPGLLCGRPSSTRSRPGIGRTGGMSRQSCLKTRLSPGASTVSEPSSFTTLQISSMVSRFSRLGMHLDHPTSTPKVTSTGPYVSGSPTLIRNIPAKREVP